MKHLNASLIAAGLILASNGTAPAGELDLAKIRAVSMFQSQPGGPAFGQPALPVPPAPVPAGEPRPLGPEFSPGEPIPVEPVALYPRVKYKDHDEMHPCAVPMIVSVPDPCACRCRKCRHAPRLVNVEIFVPPHCGPPKVKRKWFGREYEYDFGEYEVDVRPKKGYIEVDYQD